MLSLLFKFAKIVAILRYRRACAGAAGAYASLSDGGTDSEVV